MGIAVIAVELFHDWRRIPLMKIADKDGQMSEHEKVRGPASYFPAIERKYGHPVSYWFDLLNERTGLRHMEMVAWLKTDHNIGHGHANALVAHFRSQKGL